MNKKIFAALVVCLFVAGVVVACSGGSSSSSDSSTSSGNCLTTSFGTGVPTWITGNFQCVQVVISGVSYRFVANGIPPHNSYYFGSSDSRFEAMPSGNSPNPNTIAETSIILNIPGSPAVGTSSTASSFGPVGISVNGTAIYNNQANPPDTLAAELATMDAANGHPTNTGAYHHHSEPLYITDDDSALVGVMWDGFPIYGQREQGGAVPTYVDGCSPVVTNCRPFPTDLPNFHYHTTTEFPSGTYHYHVMTSDPYIIYKYGGTPGT